MEKEVSSGTILGIICIVIAVLVGIAYTIGLIVGLVFIATQVINSDFSYLLWVVPIAVILLVIGCFFKGIRYISTSYMWMWSLGTLIGSGYNLIFNSFDAMNLILLFSSIVLFFINSVIEKKFILNTEKDKK